MTTRPGQLTSRSRRGFTLIEILSVVAILGIVSATILPQMSTRDDHRAAAASRVVMSDLLYAQNRAIAQQKVHYVAFDVANGTYRVLDRWLPVNVVKNPVEGTPYIVQFGTGSASGLKEMKLVTAAFDGSPVLAFDVMGIPQTVDASSGAMTPLTSGQVVVGSGTFMMTVSVSPYSGELTVE